MATVSDANAQSSQPSAQSIVTPLTESANVMVFTIRPGGEAAVRDALEQVPAHVRSMAGRYPDATPHSVVGIGSAAWDRLFAGARPADLHPFVEIKGAVHTAPSTPGDLVLHVRARRTDVCVELGRQIRAALGDAVTLADEISGFRYFDGRQLLGFVDGTENPVGEQAVRTVVIPDGPFAGGSYLIVQKYLHDLTGWHALTTEQQEAAIGRSKADDLEMADDVKPSNSHIALNVISDEDGNELKILRQNMPFGSVGADEYGTYFIGYCHDPAILERMLRNMFIGDPPGNHDRLLDFSTAVTGTLFFIPPAEFLDDLPDAP